MRLAALILAVIVMGVGVYGGYEPPGPLYRCPKEKLLLHPCSCDIESDQGIYVSCNNTNLASMSVALNNLATFRLPIEKLTIYKCHIAKLYGSLLYKLRLRLLHILDTPIELIEEHTFLGVNSTLNEFHLLNSSLSEFPTKAFSILGNLTILNIDGHRMTTIPKDAFLGTELAGRLLRLYITSGNLTAPPIDSLQPLRKLKTLDLHSNQIGELKRNQFKGLRDVEVLDLSYNQIAKVDSSHLADLTKLGWLNVSHNSIGELTRGAFARNTVLKLLNMSHNKIKRLDSNSFRGMRFLRRLFLSDNLISDVGRGTFNTMQRIGTIDLARNFIKKIDYQMFYQMNYVEVLDVSENNVTEIQKQAFKDLYLTTINLSHNNISKVESGAFENCANITKLDLSFNRIASLPKKAFDETTYATELQFSYNRFTVMNQIPLHNMTGLKVLNVSHNSIESIPKGTFPKLYELHTIDLSHNNLSDVFNAIFQTLFSLRSLNMSYNSMETIKPSTFGPLPTLLELNLSHNRLSNIAKSAFTRLASTRQLDLSYNQLNSLFILPISTSALDLSHNQFEELPAKQWPSMNSLLSLDLSYNSLGDNLVEGSFANLLTLQRIRLDYNGITKPPWQAFSELTALQYIYLQGNNITKLERNAFGRLPVVFELNLAENNLNNISRRAFEGLLQVLVLNLTHNNLAHIPNGAFHGLVALQTLDLSHNKLTKIDNKTHGLLDDCLSIQSLNLSHNKISFITRKMFPSNPYIPYKLKEIDLSYNSVPVLTFDIVFGTSKLEKLNLSHNSIADVRKGVVGNLSRLQTIDLSYNKLHDITTDVEFFRLPKNITEIYLSDNQLAHLPTEHLINASKLAVLDVRRNNIAVFNEHLTKLVLNGTRLLFEGNPLHCDCFLRPLNRFLRNQLDLDDVYKEVKCFSPPYLDNTYFFNLTEDRLNCPLNVNTSKMLENSQDFKVLSDLRVRELEYRTKGRNVRLKWRVLKNEDVADTYIFLRNVSEARRDKQIVYQATLPYFKRNLDITAPEGITNERDLGDFQICLLAKNSRGSVRRFYPEQCKNLTESINGNLANFPISNEIIFTMAVLCAIYNKVFFSL